MQNNAKYCIECKYILDFETKYGNAIGHDLFCIHPVLVVSKRRIRNSIGETDNILITFERGNYINRLNNCRFYEERKEQ